MKQTDLFGERGADYSKVITLYNTDWTIINLTGATISSNITKSPITPHVAHFTIQVVDATKGEVKISLPNATTALLNGKYYFTIQVTLNDKITTGAYGNININNNII